MAHLVRVAELDELPPGKGKTLHVEGRDVTVFNVEGRLVATSTMPRVTGPTVTTTCDMPGHRFDVGGADSPDRLRTDELHYEVTVRDGGVFVLIEEGHTHRGDEPQLRSGPRRKKR